MKKVVGVVILICFLFTGAISYQQVLDQKAAREQEEAMQALSAQMAAEVPHADLDAIYRTHEPDEVIGSVSGRDVAWEEYFYFYGEAVSEIESIFSYMAGSGYPVSWNDAYQGDLTFADVPAESAAQSIRQYEAIENYAEKNGIVLSAEAEAEIDQQIQAAAEQYCGENATPEAFQEYLSYIYLPLPVYRQLLHANAVYQQTFTELYGEPTEDGSSEAEYAAELQEAFSAAGFEYAEGFSIPAVEDYLA